MPISCDFFPDPLRAAVLDKRMHGELGASLDHVCEASRGIIAFDAERMGRLTIRLGAGEQVMPPVFARYYELVDAIRQGEMESASTLFAELGAAAPAPSGFQVVSLGDETLGSESERYARMMNSDASIDLGFQAPDPDSAAAFRGRLEDGFALLDCAIPELSGEIRAIIRQVVISGSDPARKMQVDGGSHYQLWGALFLNCNYHHTAVAVAEVLAHETAHSLLFGFCTDEPLVENADEELFASPLRTDLRPMDGIYHATFVSARMHWAMSQLALSPALTERERADAHTAAEADLRNFHLGRGVIAEHGRLTGLGADLMAGADLYMGSVH